MIVQCPKCNFEQPLDEFCAQCGAPLKKLLEEQKRQQLKRRSIGRLATIFVGFFSLAVIGLLIVESGNEKKTTSSEKPSKEVVLSLKPEKIKSERKKISNPVAPAKLSVDTEPRARALQPTEQDVVDTQEPDEKRKSFVRVDFFTAGECEEKIPVGLVTAEELETLNNCSYIIFNENFEQQGDFSVSDNSFESKVSWNVLDRQIKMTSTFLTPDTESKQSENITLEIEPDSNYAGYIYVNPFLGQVSLEDAPPSLSDSIFASVLYGVGEEAEAYSEAYFLFIFSE